MAFFQSIWEVISGTIISIEWNDVLDILIIAFLVYKGIQLIRETRAAQLLKGIMLLVLALFVSSFLNLKTMNLLLNNVFNWGLLAVVVLFQPEMRRALEKVGRTRLGSFSLLGAAGYEGQQIELAGNAIESVANICEAFSDTKTGALIVFERQIRLGEQISTGVEINASISEELLGNIFFKNSPLHDGAVIIRENRILAAACFLPKPQKEEFISRNLGSRHRAAIGMSENSDAIVVVVSEETGAISTAENGRLTRYLTKGQLTGYLNSRLIPEKSETKPLWRSKKK